MNISSQKNCSSKIQLCSFHKIGAAIASLLVCTLTQGCSTPSGRSAAKTAALGNLSPAERQVVLNGDIHKGLSKDAVYVAWGSPSKTTVHNTARGPQECWTYVQTFNGYGGGYYGISRGLIHGKHSDHYNTDDFYPAPTDAQTLGGTPSTEVPVKRVVFENGRVVNYETAHQQNEKDDDEG